MVLCNPRPVFDTMPLALVALGSALDRRRFEPVIVDARLEEARGAVAVGITDLTVAPLADALAATRAPAAPASAGLWSASSRGPRNSSTG